MFDFIKSFIELLVSGADLFDQKRDKRIKRDVGRQLMVCYLRCLEICETGDRILDQLERYTNPAFRDRIADPNEGYWTSALRSYLVQQSLNLVRLGRAVRSTRKYLRVFAPETAEAFDPLISGKAHAVAVLTQLLENDKLPVTFALTDRKLMYLNAYEIDHTSIDATEDWGTENLVTVEQYLKTENPRERLEQIKQLAEELRSQMLRHFDAEDLIIELHELDDYSRG